MKIVLKVKFADENLLDDFLVQKKGIQGKIQASPKEFESYGRRAMVSEKNIFLKCWSIKHALSVLRNNLESLEWSILKKN